jgi:hypothetical protein
MKAIGIILGTVGASCFALSMAFANPGMLPKHPGYPAQGKSPTTGQSTANDQGQTNAVGGATLEASQAFGGGKAVVNDVSDANNARIKKSMGAGRLPETDTMNTVPINPAGATSTVIN